MTQSPRARWAGATAAGLGFLLAASPARAEWSWTLLGITPAGTVSSLRPMIGPAPRVAAGRGATDPTAEAAIPVPPAVLTERATEETAIAAGVPAGTESNWGLILLACVLAAFVRRKSSAADAPA